VCTGHITEVKPLKPPDKAEAEEARKGSRSEERDVGLSSMNASLEQPQ